MSFLVLDSAAATTIAVSAGNHQVAPPSTRLPVDPQVLVTDGSGNPVQGVSVTFAVTAGGGSLVGSAVQTTDVGGFASIGWTLGASPGTDTLTATVGFLTGSPVTFTATDTVSAAAWADPCGACAVAFFS